MTEPKRQLTVVDRINQVGEQFDSRKDEFAKLFKDQATVERFVRVSKNALTKDPELINADRASLFQACMDLANLGLMPDGKQAALTVYNTKVKGEDGRDKWIKKCQALAMVKGVIEVLYRTGRVKNVIVDVVYKGEDFDVQGGDEPYIKHKPDFEIRNDLTDDAIIAAYCIIVTTDGEKHMRALSRKKINRARAAAKSDNVWSKHFDEMAIKTAVHSTSKRLPFEVPAIEQEAAFYDFDKVPVQAPKIVRLAPTVHDLALSDESAPTAFDAEAVEVVEQPSPEAPVEVAQTKVEPSAVQQPETKDAAVAPPMGLIGWAIKKVDAATTWADVEGVFARLREERAGPWEAAQASGEHIRLYEHVRGLPVWEDGFPGDRMWAEISTALGEA